MTEHDDEPGPAGRPRPDGAGADRDPEPSTHRIEVDHFDDWQATVTGTLLRFAVDRARPQEFRGEVSRVAAGGVGLVGMSCGAHAAHRGPSAIDTAQPGDYVLSLQLAGRARFDQDGRTATLRPGELVFYDSTRPVTVTSDDGYRSVCLQFPRELARARPEPLAALTATPFGEADGLAPVVAGALDGLHRTLPAGRGGPARLQAVRQTVGLFASMVAGELDARGLAPDDPRRALRERVDRYIDRHLGDPDLSPARIAAAHYVSTRTLHAVFEGADATVAATVRARRLERACADLADPWQAGVPVAVIAARWGFRTPSRFGQACRTATGLSPARYRAAHLCPT